MPRAHNGDGLQFAPPPGIQRSMTSEHDVFPCGVTSLRIPGPTGALELMATCPDEQKAVGATGVICHPHPLQGGTMTNKVVHTLARAFGDLGLRTVRFNFRGVGASEGVFGNAEGELEDLLAVLDWTRACRPHDVIWLGGFSFGGYVAARAAQQVPVAQIVTVAPAVNLYPFASMRSPNAPWLVVQGDDDDVVPANAVNEWAQRMQPPPTIVMLSGVGHFFHGRLNDLRQAILSHVNALPA